MLKWRRFEVHRVVCAFFFAELSAVNSNDASTAMIAMTVSNSMSVKARGMRLRPSVPSVGTAEKRQRTARTPRPGGIGRGLEPRDSVLDGGQASNAFRPR